MKRFPLAVHYDDVNAPVTPTRLASLVSENKTIWARVAPHSSAEPYLRSLDYVQLVAADSSRGLSIVEWDCQTALAIGRSGQKPLAHVQQICRASASPRYWLPTAGLPWRLLLFSANMSRLFLLADKGARLRSRAIWVLQQLRPLPDPMNAAATVGGFYNRSELVDQYAGEASSGLREEERLLADRYLYRGSHILDIGCGTGREAFGFAQLGLRVTGVDSSPAMIARAAQNPYVLTLGSRIRFLHTSGTSLDLPAGLYDAVFINGGVLPWTPGRRNRVAFLRRCASLTKPGGIITTPRIVRPRPPSRRERLLVEGPRRFTRWMLRDRTPERGDRWDRYLESPESWTPLMYHHKYCDENEILEEIREAGLRVIDRISGVLVMARES